MAPEVLLLDPTEIVGKQDIFAAGLVLLELCCGMLPLELFEVHLDPHLMALFHMPAHQCPQAVAPKVSGTKTTLWRRW